MKKAIKTLFILILFLAIFPALAGFAVMALWNNIMPALCGFSTITFWQSAGLFLMGQILTGGIIILLFIAGGMIHHSAGHPHAEWKSHWHDMTEEQRREFIERRRREHFGFRHRQNRSENGAE